MNWNIDSDAKLSMVSGTLLALLFNINSEELLSTIILAIIGATVSFGVSLFWKKIIKRRRRD